VSGLDCREYLQQHQLLADYDRLLLSDALLGCGLGGFGKQAAMMEPEGGCGRRPWTAEPFASQRVALPGCRDGTVADTSVKAQRADIDGIDENVQAGIKAALLQSLCRRQHHAARARCRFLSVRKPFCPISVGASSRLIIAMNRATSFGVKNWPICALRISISVEPAERKQQAPGCESRARVYPSG